MRGRSNVKFDFKLLLALLICSTFFFAFLGSYPLLNNNEGIYAGISQWFFQTGNYILPHLNGVEYIEKPPMLYWLIAFCFKIFGTNEWSARLVPATSGFLIGLFIYFFLQEEKHTTTPIWALMIWSSCVGTIAFSRLIFFDMLFAFFLSGIMISLFLYRKKTSQKVWIYSAYLFAAFSVLTKGLLGIVLPAISIFIYLFIEQEADAIFSLKRLVNVAKEMFSYFSVVPMLIFLIIAIPWHVAAGLKDPDFWYFYFINEHFLRFLGKRIPMDYYSGSVYYYILRLLGYMAPWIIFLPAFIFRNKPYPQKRKMPSSELFCWSWFLTVLVFFSVAKAKANYYIIAGMPPLAVLFAFRLRDAKDFIFKRYIFILLLVTFILSTIVLIFTLLSPFILEKFYTLKLLSASIYKKVTPWLGYYDHFQLPIILLIIAFLICIYMVFNARKKENLRHHYVWLIVILTSFLTSTIMSQFHLFQEFYSTKKIISDLSKKYDKKDIDLYLYIYFEKLSTSAYYLERSIPIINSKSKDLWYGLKKTDTKKLEINIQELLKFPVKRPTFVLMEKRHSKEFKRESIKSGFKFWKSYGSNVLFYKNKAKKYK
ncbi:glycosyltransferase family 39 protein [Lentisphaerota bacterium ZTH]|nr:glycosyltransferase family 39 protein [Lentisphaerota bacterium]WET06085.1 glycosyltransferase family 39 protein [Lentisphaerota bacterium ZTH]